MKNRRAGQKGQRPAARTRAIRSMLVCGVGTDIAAALPEGTWNTQPDVGAQPPEEVRCFWPVLELVRLFGALRNAERCATLEVARVDVGAVLHQVLHHFVPPPKCRAMQRRKVGFIDRVHVGAVFDEDLDGRLRTQGAVSPWFPRLIRA